MTVIERGALLVILWCMVGYMVMGEGNLAPIIVAMIAQAVFIFAGKEKE